MNFDMTVVFSERSIIFKYGGQGCFAIGRSMFN